MYARMQEHTQNVCYIDDIPCCDVGFSLCSSSEYSVGDLLLETTVLILMFPCPCRDVSLRPSFVSSLNDSKLSGRDDSLETPVLSRFSAKNYNMNDIYIIYYTHNLLY